MLYKALSFWQPWADLIALHEKTIETRTWETKFRGDLLICASKKWDKELSTLTKECYTKGSPTKNIYAAFGCCGSNCQGS